MSFEASAERFRKTVQQAAVPPFPRAGRTIHRLPYLQAELRFPIGQTLVLYQLFREEIPDTARGVSGLDFVPSHALQIQTPSRITRSVQDTAVFGLHRTDERFVRCVHDGVSHKELRRDLVDQEVEDLVAFATAPHTSREELERLLMLTAVEENEFARARSRVAALAEHFVEQMRAIDEAEFRITPWG